MTQTTITTPKPVTIIARVQFKADPRKVCYRVRSSNGKDVYTTCLFDGKATSCTCPCKTGNCYHRRQLEAREQERAATKAAQAEAAVEQPTRVADSSPLASVEKAKIARFDRALAAAARPLVAIAPVPDLGNRGALTKNRAFSLMR